MRIDDIEFIILDTETTGLEPESGHKVIEIAAVRLKGNAIIDKFNSLVNPLRSIPQDALDIHHISPEMLTGAPLMKEVMPKFLKFIKGGILCAYNAAFDMGFINQELKLLNQQLPSDTHIIDMLLMARRCLPYLQRHSLWFVSESLGIQKIQEHRALSDVYMSIEVFKRLKDIAVSKGIDGFTQFQTVFGLNTPYLEDMRNQKISRLQEAIDLKVNIKIKYFARQSAEVTEREVVPLEIKQEGNKYYLVGYCNLRKEERTFSVNGILHLEII